MNKLLLLILALGFISPELYSQGGTSCTSAKANPIAFGTTYPGQSTCGKGNNYAGTGGCNGSTNYSGNDFFYNFCTTQSGFISVKLTNIISGTSGSTAYVSLSLFKGCPGSGTCITSQQTVLLGIIPLPGSLSLSASVAAGECYYIVVDESYILGSAPCVNYTIGTTFIPKIIQPSCTNMGFENGLTGWSPNYGTVSEGSANASIPVYTVINTGLRPLTARHTIVTGGTDECGGFNKVFAGSSSLKIGDNQTDNKGEQIYQTFKVSASNTSFTYNYACVLEDPSHTNKEQPFFKAILFDQNGDTIPCSPYIVTAGANVTGFIASSTCSSVQYKPWSSVNVDLSKYIGQEVTAEFTVGDCTQGGHYGYAYLDISCAPSLMIAQNDTICEGGTATLKSPDGYASYLWNPGGATTQNITVSPTAKTIYTLTLTSFNGCKQIFTDTIWVEPKIVVQTTAANAMCGGCNGSVLATPQTGSVPYTYAWSNGATGSTASGLCPATYSVTVTSAGGCTGTSNASITAGAGLSITPVPTNVTCKGPCNGSAGVTIAGGVSPYTYLWSNAQTASTVTSLCAGTYTVTVNDVNGCSSSQTTSITEPVPVTSKTVTTNVVCNGNATGSSTITVTGGTAPYAYTWSAPISTQTTATATNLPAGSFSVTISDANGCTISSTVTVTEPPPLTITPTSSNTACGASNGTASVVAGGGTGTYNYVWNSPITATTASISNLAAGNYTVTVTDANNCTLSISLTISNTPASAITLTGTPVSCNGGKDGTATITTGASGIPPFTYSWSGAAAGQVTATVTGLTAGTYTSSVTDGSGCMSTNTVIITEPTLLLASLTKTDILCFGGSDGSITLSAAGATPPYNYSWSAPAGQQTTSAATNLIAGNYVVTITDSKGCTISQSQTITEPPALALTPTNTNELCAGGNTATATITASGGTPVYTYLWSTPGGFTSPVINGLTAGTYICTVTDANTCTLSQVITITEPTPITITSSFTQSICNNSNGSATANPAGGTSPYNFLWDNSTAGQISPTATLLSKGTYTCTVTDANACTISTTATVPESGKPLAATTGTNVGCFGGADGTANVILYNGTSPYTYFWSNQATSASISGLAAGIYFVSVTDANSCTTTASFNVTEPPVLTLATSAPTAFCAGLSTKLTATASGGTPGYSYDWDNGANTGSSYTVLPPTTQTYNVKVTDANNCTITQTITTTVLPLPVARLTADDTTGCVPLCINFKNLTSNSVSCSWKFGEAGSTSNNCTGRYCYENPGKFSVSLSVVDKNGCKNTSTHINMVETYPTPVAAFTVNSETTTILNPKFEFANQSKGAVSWLWDFGDPADNKTSTLRDPKHTYTDTGTYCIGLTAKNMQGCWDTTTHCVKIGPEFTFFVPNAFSPNGNSINDTFFGKGIGILKYKMTIFDRWGDQIFTSEEINKGWDGKVDKSGEVSQQDVFVYKITLTDVFQKMHQYVGHVTLIK